MATITIGTGSGNIPFSTANNGDDVTVTPGTYTNADSVSNKSNIVFRMTGVTVTSTIGLAGLNTVTFDGPTFTGNGGFKVNGNVQGFTLSNWTANSTVHLIDVTQSGMVYNGNVSTLAMYNTLIYNGKMTGCYQMLIGSFSGATNFQNAIDLIEVHDINITNQLGDMQVISGNGIYRLKAYSWTINNSFINGATDAGMINVTGNAVIHNIYQNGNWGYIGRIFGCSLGTTIVDTWVYNCIRMNGIKYPLMDCEQQSGDVTNSGPQTRTSNFHIVYNTQINCGDYEPSGGSWYASIMTTPAVINPTGYEIRNNVLVNCPSWANQFVQDFTGTIPAGQITNNMYFATYQLAGMTDATTVKLNANSPLIGQAINIPQITNDFYGTIRPQGGTYDIGAVEYTTGTPPIQPPVNPTTSAPPTTQAPPTTAAPIPPPITKKLIKAVMRANIVTLTYSDNTTLGIRSVSSMTDNVADLSVTVVLLNGRSTTYR